RGGRERFRSDSGETDCSIGPYEFGCLHDAERSAHCSERTVEYKTSRRERSALGSGVMSPTLARTRAALHAPTSAAIIPNVTRKRKHQRGQSPKSAPPGLCAT